MRSSFSTPIFPKAVKKKKRNVERSHQSTLGGEPCAAEEREICFDLPLAPFCSAHAGDPESGWFRFFSPHWENRDDGRRRNDIVLKGRHRPVCNSSNDRGKEVFRRPAASGWKREGKNHPECGSVVLCSGRTSAPHDPDIDLPPLFPLELVINCHRSHEIPTCRPRLPPRLPRRINLSRIH